MRILFAGTAKIALPSLEALIASHHTIVGVLTAPDRGAGRGKRNSLSPVKLAAVRHALPTVQPERLGSDARSRVAPLGPELLVVVAYGRIFGPKFLGLFPHGGLNVHPSLLPKYRGPAPIPAAILAGESETGVTVQRLALEVDSGNIVTQSRVKLDGTETTASLSEDLATIGSGLLVEAVDALESGNAADVQQDHSAATFTSLVTKADGEIEWGSPAAEIERMVRAYQPWPLAHTYFGDQRLAILESEVVDRASDTATDGAIAIGSAKQRPGTVLHVDKRHGVLVQTGNGLLALRRLQLQARKALDWKDFLNGVRDFVGTVLGG